MKKLPRDPIRFDVFDALAVYGQTEKVSLKRPEAVQGFISRIRDTIDKSLANDAFLYGQRTQVMFEYLVPSLGAVKLLKAEDAGEIYASDDNIQIPDFRLVLADGRQLLVEVKNYYQGSDVKRDYQLEKPYVDGLLRYADLMQCDLRLAIYWGRWSLWTLVQPESLEIQGDQAVIGMATALVKNEMYLLGDRMVGTRFPLCLRILADKEKPRRVEEDGEGTFTIGGVEFYCAGQRITKKEEQGIAFYLMANGRWIEEPMISFVTDNQVEWVEIPFNPPQDNHQGFELVGSLSEMFSRYFIRATLDKGELGQIRADVNLGVPGRLVPEGYRGEALPLWIIMAKPACPESAPEKTVS